MRVIYCQLCVAVNFPHAGGMNLDGTLLAREPRLCLHYRSPIDPPIVLRRSRTYARTLSSRTLTQRHRGP